MHKDLLAARSMLKSELVNNADRVVSYIRQAIPNVLQIGLFGSVARDTFTCTSDADIYVVTADRLSHYIKGDIRCFADEHNCDVVFFTSETFKGNNLLLQNIRRDGRVLYEKLL